MRKLLWKRLRLLGMQTAYVSLGMVLDYSPESLQPLFRHWMLVLLSERHRLLGNRYLAKLFRKLAHQKKDC